MAHVTGRPDSLVSDASSNRQSLDGVEVILVTKGLGWKRGHGGGVIACPDQWCDLCEQTTYCHLKTCDIHSLRQRNVFVLTVSDSDGDERHIFPDLQANLDWLKNSELKIKAIVLDHDGSSIAMRATRILINWFARSLEYVKIQNGEHVPRIGHYKGKVMTTTWLRLISFGSNRMSTQLGHVLTLNAPMLQLVFSRLSGTDEEMKMFEPIDTAAKFVREVPSGEPHSQAILEGYTSIWSCTKNDRSQESMFAALGKMKRVYAAAMSRLPPGSTPRTYNPETRLGPLLDNIIRKCDGHKAIVETIIEPDLQSLYDYLTGVTQLSLYNVMLTRLPFFWNKAASWDRTRRVFPKLMGLTLHFKEGYGLFDTYYGPKDEKREEKEHVLRRDLKEWVKQAFNRPAMCYIQLIMYFPLTPEKQQEMTAAAPRNVTLTCSRHDGLPNDGHSGHPATLNQVDGFYWYRRGSAGRRQQSQTYRAEMPSTSYRA